MSDRLTSPFLVFPSGHRYRHQAPQLQPQQYGEYTLEKAPDLRGRCILRCSRAHPQGWELKYWIVNASSSSTNFQMTDLNGQGGGM